MPTLTTWNPSDKGAPITLSNGNNTATGSGGNAKVRGTTSHVSTGKYYFEQNGITIVGGQGFYGLGNSGLTLTGNDTTGALAISLVGQLIPFVGVDFHAAPSGHVLCWAIDFGAGKVWVRYDNGSWNNSGTDDPATGTGGQSFSGLGALFPCIFLQNGGTCTLNVDSSAYSFTAPSGFAPWDGFATPSGTWFSTEASDRFAAVGYPGYPFPRGDLTVTEASDVFAAQGFERDSGVWHSAELQDSFNALATLPVRGPWASTEAHDVFNATGLGRGENGTWITTEAQDIFHATGQTPFAGSFNVTETPDHFRAFGSGVVRHQRRRVFFVT